MTMNLRRRMIRFDLNTLLVRNIFTLSCAVFFIVNGSKGVAREQHDDGASTSTHSGSKGTSSGGSSGPGVVVSPAASRSEKNEVPIAVLHSEGLVHGFLILRSLEGEILADGDISQLTHGDGVTSRLVFHFRDGSLFDETVVFSQRRIFRILKYRLLQKGPAFKEPMTLTIDGASGHVNVRYTEKNGAERSVDAQLNLPPNLANGLIFTLLKNVHPGTPQISLAVVAATPKPRIVKLLISPEGDEWFKVGNSAHKAIRYVVKVEIGGVTGVVAPLVRKQPPDAHIWILDAEAPVFVRSEGPLSSGDQMWRVDLASPVWKQNSAEDSPRQR